jgi:hypothetical protein
LARLSGGRISAELCDGLMPGQSDVIKLSYPELESLTNRAIIWVAMAVSFISLSTEQNEALTNRDEGQVLSGK